MFTIEENWKTRFKGAHGKANSNKSGWIADHPSDSTFVEPQLTVIEGDPTTAQVLVVAAPGAVGKSTYARILAAETSTVIVDLAKTEPLGGNFFVGGIANAFGFDALAEVMSGRLGLVVDALDEAQLRSGPEGFTAGLLDLANIVSTNGALPAAIFGRASAAEDAWLILDNSGVKTCLLQIDFFDEDQAKRFISKKLNAIASRSEKMRSAYLRHSKSFEDFAVETRTKLMKSPGGSDKRFAGYAPVLDAICSFTLDEENLNPATRTNDLSSKGPAELIEKISQAILVREQEKLLAQLRETAPLPTQLDIATVYSPSEQLSRLSSAILHTPVSESVVISDPDVREIYEKMVMEFAPQHPFLDGANRPSNAAFAAYVFVWALRNAKISDEARQILTARPNIGSGLVFDLYVNALEDPSAINPARLPLSHVGLLYTFLGMQASQRERPELEVIGDDDPEIEVEFNLSTVQDSDEVPAQGRSYGPYASDPDSPLSFSTALSGISVIAPVTVIIGDGNSATLTDPVTVDATRIEFNAREIYAYKSHRKPEDGTYTIALSAVESDLAKVASISVHGADFSVALPGVQAYPWSQYATTPPHAPSDAIEILRRRTRRVLTAFRSHSKGSLRRLAAKIDHARMMKKDQYGPLVVQRLLDDGILKHVESGKFYELNADRLAAQMSMDYQALQKQRWTPASDVYLASICQ
ncbi:hypothetical protein [Tahibacter harae]|uniref:Uncharacterized protein n=1 Tax=Tahibacter harae TaxID=2963937 RepID=A0ABT1QNQ9_9GAMM|nr:hypothetical protein [Tahibacter harae]MCQ4163850.1 hypothetical protein [Tahibacter harae]